VLFFFFDFLLNLLRDGDLVLLSLLLDLLSLSDEMGKRIIKIKICLNKTYSKCHIGKNLSGEFPVENTHQLLVCADDVNVYTAMNLWFP
jgi:hypothetical protein